MGVGRTLRGHSSPLRLRGHPDLARSSSPAPGEVQPHCNLASLTFSTLVGGDCPCHLIEVDGFAFLLDCGWDERFSIEELDPIIRWGRSTHVGSTSRERMGGVLGRAGRGGMHARLCPHWVEKGCNAH